jgi:hypothetical protein
LLKIYKILDSTAGLWIMFKYRINEVLANMPMKDYRKVLKIIPGALGISSNTFCNYRNIRNDEDKDIPHQKVVLLEKIFGLNSGELDNFELAYKPIQQLLNEYTDSNNE